MHPLDLVTDERRELLCFDAIRVALGFVHGLELEQIRLRLQAAGMRPHRAADGCESWHWPGHAPSSPCQHGLAFVEEQPA